MIKAKIVCDKLNKSIELDQDKSLIDQLRENDVPIASSCKGDGVCQWCKIQILKGSENISEKTELERRSNLEVNERLLCQIKLTGDVVIETTYW